MAGSAAGIAVAFILWQAIARMLPAMPGSDLSERLSQGLASLLPALVLINLMIAGQMLLRVRTGAVNPLAGADGPSLQANQRVLTNSVEQMAGFAPAYLALAAGAEADWMPFVIAAGFVFALARLVFWTGYLVDPLVRSPGMAATFTINCATLSEAIWVWWP